MSDMDLQKFHQLCAISIIVEEDGSNPVLCVTANVRDSDGEYHELKRCVALNPLIEMLAGKIRVYHDQLHAEMSVSGDNAFVAPILAPGIDPMEIAGWADSIKKAARRLGESKAVKTLYHDIKKAGSQASRYAKKGARFAAEHKGELAMAASLVPGGGPALAAAMKAGPKILNAVKEARKNNPEALGALRKIKTLAEDGDLNAMEAYKAAKTFNELLKVKEESEDSDTNVSGPWHKTDIMDSDVVSGWLYNRPYRTNAQVLMDAAGGKFPTVSLAIRQGWHDGFDFISTMKRKNISVLGF